ncbi:MAG: hypothetical protein JNL79_10435 [Myxococcales bacterium]|nr:hypothetical protein [Myxococcales bacterium]
MPPKKPPLEAVRLVRASLAEAAQERLVEGVAAEAAAEAAAARAAEVQRRARVDGAAAEAREREGLASPRDFAQQAAFGVGLERRLARLEAETTAAEATARAARRHTVDARAALAAAQAELEIVERHQAEARRRAEAEAEDRAGEQAEEAHAGRRGRG